MLLKCPYVRLSTNISDITIKHVERASYTTIDIVLVVLVSALSSIMAISYQMRHLMIFSYILMTKYNINNVHQVVVCVSSDKNSVIGHLRWWLGLNTTK